MVGKEELGLSLTLGSSENLHHPSPLQLNLMPVPHKPQWADLLASSEAAARPLRGIDVNRAPTTDRESDEEAGASSLNSTLSSVSGKRDQHAHTAGGGEEHFDMEQDRDSSRGGGGISDEEDGEGCRKKLRLSKDQSAVLEESFKEHSTLNPKQKQALAKQLNLRPRQVEVWFQNRRARTKLKQTEVDCEFLKRCCENLTDENRRLQKEVAELRALKLSPQFYMHMTPPTTLTMCPSCERVATASNNQNGIPVARSVAGISSPDHHYHHQRQFATPSTGWGPVPMRAAFMGVHPQRS